MLRLLSRGKSKQFAHRGHHLKHRDDHYHAYRDHRRVKHKCEHVVYLDAFFVVKKEPSLRILGNQPIQHDHTQAQNEHSQVENQHQPAALVPPEQVLDRVVGCKGQVYSEKQEANAAEDADGNLLWVGKAPLHCEIEDVRSYNQLFLVI